VCENFNLSDKTMDLSDKKYLFDKKYQLSKQLKILSLQI
jgi:hypothetical protein